MVLWNFMPILPLLSFCIHLQLFSGSYASQHFSDEFEKASHTQKPRPRAMSLRSIFHHDLNNPAEPFHMRSIPEDVLIAFGDDPDVKSGVSRLNIQTRYEAISFALSKTRALADAGLNIPIRKMTYDDDDRYWEIRESVSPDVSHKETLINLAKMSSDAYYASPSDKGWLNTSQGFNKSSGFGWDSDGLSGQVFVSDDNSTAIIAYKGTSIWPVDTGRPQDRVNDNLLFSCCCATQRPDPYFYGKVCDCRQDIYSCNSTCLTQELASPKRYYVAALQVYANVTTMYPNARLWTIGHSLGGTMASLVGLTYNIPAITFETPPQRLAAERLGLVIPEDLDLLNHMGQYHFGNTADPIYMGSCNGVLSTCAAAGFNFESQCFAGLRCVYDTVEDKKWYVNIIHHRLNNIIPNVLEAYDGVANCTLDDKCVDCYNWRFSM